MVINEEKTWTMTMVDGVAFIQPGDGEDLTAVE